VADLDDSEAWERKVGFALSRPMVNNKTAVARDDGRGRAICCWDIP
jgi:hypothetical protein